MTRSKEFLMKIHSELCELRASAVQSRFPFRLRIAALGDCRFQHLFAILD